MMRNSQYFFPRIGFVIATDGGQLVLSSSIVFGKSRLLTLPMLRVKNDTGRELVKGDKIIYTVAKEKYPRNRSITIKKILAHDLPVAPTIKQALEKLRIAVNCERDVELDKEEIRHFFEAFVDVSLDLTTEEDASLIIHVTSKDEGAAICPDPLMGILRGINAVPFRIDVPFVSGKTVRFLYRVSKPVLKDTELKLAVLSLRIIHILFHAVGYQEHMELPSLAKEYEGRIRGDPSLVKPIPDLKCLMSWRNLHLLASTYDFSKVSFLSVGSLMCKQCETHYANSKSFGLSDLEALHEVVQGMRSSISRETRPKRLGFSRFGVLYVLEVAGASSSVLLGVSPIRSSQTTIASQGISMQELENNFLNGVGLLVPSKLLKLESKVGTIKKGHKLLVEFDYNSLQDEEEFILSSIRILEKLSENHRIDDATGLLHRLGVGRMKLTIRIRWASGVDVASLREAARQIGRLTGWKFMIDGSATPELDSASAKMSSAIEKLTSTSGPEEFRNIIYDLQDIIDTIGPRKREVVDKPMVIVFILPQFHYLPISTIGDMALGQTIRRVFSILQMPERYEPVHLSSEACKECSKNYTEGKDYRYSNHLSVLLIHELLHIAAGLSDHRGECRLCYFDKPEMFPLRFSTCEKCIQEDGDYVHRNCLMSYACQFCIASRLSEIKDLKDVLCHTCVSRIRPETNYVHSYFARINNEIYRELIAEAGDKWFKANVTSD